jgi:hypothetical protein
MKKAGPTLSGNLVFGRIHQLQKRNQQDYRDALVQSQEQRYQEQEDQPARMMPEKQAKASDYKQFVSHERSSF